MNSTCQPTVVHVELTGPLRRAAGTDRLTITIETAPTLAQLLTQLRQILPQTQAFLPLQFNEAGECCALPPGLLIARGSQMLPSAPLFPLTSGDQLTLVPMISGG